MFGGSLPAAAGEGPIVGPIRNRHPATMLLKFEESTRTISVFKRSFAMVPLIAVNGLSSSIRDGGPGTAFCGDQVIAVLSSTGLISFYTYCLFTIL